MWAQTGREGIQGKKEKGPIKVTFAASNEQLTEKLRPTGEAKSKGKFAEPLSALKEKMNSGRALSDMTNLVGCQSARERDKTLNL